MTDYDCQLFNAFLNLGFERFSSFLESYHVESEDKQTLTSTFTLLCESKNTGPVDNHNAQHEKNSSQAQR